jgi:hypothetical protein
MTHAKFAFYVVLSVVGVFGYIYGWPVYINIENKMTNANFIIFNIVIFITGAIIVWFLYNLLGVVDDEIEYRRCGDIKIDGEITEDFRLNTKYFQD